MTFWDFLLALFHMILFCSCCLLKLPRDAFHTCYEHSRLKFSTSNHHHWYLAWTTPPSQCFLSFYSVDGAVQLLSLPHLAALFKETGTIFKNENILLLDLLQMETINHFAFVYQHKTEFWFSAWYITNIRFLQIILRIVSIRFFLVMYCK